MTAAVGIESQIGNTSARGMAQTGARSSTPDSGQQWAGAFSSSLRDVSSAAASDLQSSSRNPPQRTLRSSEIAGKTTLSPADERSGAAPSATVTTPAQGNLSSDSTQNTSAASKSSSTLQSGSAVASAASSTEKSTGAEVEKNVQQNAAKGRATKLTSLVASQSASDGVSEKNKAAQLAASQAGGNAKNAIVTAGEGKSNRRGNDKNASDSSMDTAALQTLLATPTVVQAAPVVIAQPVANQSSAGSIPADESSAVTDVLGAAGSAAVLADSTAVPLQTLSEQLTASGQSLAEIGSVLSGDSEHSGPTQSAAPVVLPDGEPLTDRMAVNTLVSSAAQSDDSQLTGNGIAGASQASAGLQSTINGIASSVVNKDDLQILPAPPQQSANSVQNALPYTATVDAEQRLQAQLQTTATDSAQLPASTTSLQMNAQVSALTQSAQSEAALAKDLSASAQVTTEVQSRQAAADSMAQTATQQKALSERVSVLPSDHILQSASDAATASAQSASSASMTSAKDAVLSTSPAVTSIASTTPTGVDALSGTSQATTIVGRRGTSASATRSVTDDRNPAVQNDTAASDAVDKLPGSAAITRSATASAKDSNTEKTQSIAASATESGSDAAAMNREAISGQMLTSHSNTGASTAQVPAATIHDTFAALDSNATTGQPSWVRTNPGQVEAGFHDADLGWVSVRATNSGGTVHASIVPGSESAAQTLSGHLEALNQYLSDHATPITSVTMSEPVVQAASSSAMAQNNQPGSGSQSGNGQESAMQSALSQNMQQGSQHGQSGNSGDQTSSSGQNASPLLSWGGQKNAVDTVPARGEAIYQPAGGQYISVLA